MADEPEDTTVIGDRQALLKLRPGRERAYVIVIAGPSVGEMFKLGDGGFVGRGDQCEFRIADSEISRKHARIVKDGDEVVIEDLGSTNGTFVNGQPVRRRPLEDGDKIQVGTTTILKFSYHDDLDEQFQRQMYESALRDGLTRAFNKKYFQERLDSEFAYAARHESPLSLLLFDLDHFKRINDTFGHLAGDHVLAGLSSTVAATIRKEDVFARYGGEEFALLSRGIDAEGARQFAERMRRAIETTRFDHSGVRIPVTISVGVASTPDESIAGPTALVAAADQALYAAKEAGRNRVVLYAPARP